MLELNTIHAQPGSVHQRKRLGRGQGSGPGPKGGRGNKGQKARKSGNVRPGFEGGQTPLYRRLPKFGFNNPGRREVAIFNLRDLAKLEMALLSDLSLDVLKKGRQVKNSVDRLVILGDGEISSAVKVRAHRVSASAKEKIEKAGGQVEILPTPAIAMHTLNRKSKNRTQKKSAKTS